MDWLKPNFVISKSCAVPVLLCAVMTHHNQGMFERPALPIYVQSWHLAALALGSLGLMSAHVYTQGAGVVCLGYDLPGHTV